MLKRLMSRYYTNKLAADLVAVGPAQYEGDFSYLVIFSRSTQTRFLWWALTGEFAATGLANFPTDRTSELNHQFAKLRDLGWNVQFRQLDA